MTEPIPLVAASPDCAELFFAGRVRRCATMWHAASLPQLRAVLTDRLADTTGPVTLDLIGHSTRGHNLLRLGGTAIDMLDPYVAGFFRAVAEERLLDRLEVRAVRLLGCGTGVTEAGGRTLRMLARTLRRPVFGTLVPLLKSHSTAVGFDPRFQRVLVRVGDADEVLAELSDLDPG